MGDPSFPSGQDIERKFLALEGFRMLEYGVELWIPSSGKGILIHKDQDVWVELYVETHEENPFSEYYDQTVVEQKIKVYLEEPGLSVIARKVKAEIVLRVLVYQMTNDAQRLASGEHFDPTKPTELSFDIWEEVLG